MSKTSEASDKVTVSQTDEDENDPALSQFLSLLKNNKNIHSINPALLSRVQSLISGVEINLDKPLSKEKVTS